VEARFIILAAVLTATAALPAVSQRERRPVVWNNPHGPKIPGVEHGSFRSPSMGVEVGYNVFLPPGYAEGRRR
jgi:endo-1,4-beta-xylanase